MNTNFNVLDKVNNTEKKASAIVRFKSEDKEYLIYSIDENEQNRQILVSRLIKNSEGKNYIENITDEEKSKLNNIVYNIVILLPSEFQKGADAKTIISDFSTKYSVTLTKDNLDLLEQEYYSNCSIAITNSELVNTALNFYQQYLENSEVQVNNSIPTWTMPTEDNSKVMPLPSEAPKAPVAPVTPVENSNIEKASEPLPNNSTEAPLQSLDSITEDTLLNIKPIGQDAEQDSEPTLPNPQAEKLAVVSDPSLSQAAGINPAMPTGQPNLGKANKSGFANSKYVIIGTVCLVLSIAVIVAAYFIIRNIK